MCRKACNRFKLNNSSKFVNCPSLMTENHATGSLLSNSAICFATRRLGYLRLGCSYVEVSLKRSGFSLVDGIISDYALDRGELSNKGDIRDISCADSLYENQEERESRFFCEVVPSSGRIT